MMLKQQTNMGIFPHEGLYPAKIHFQAISGNFHITHTSINEQLTCPCPCRHFYFVLKGIQPERWLRIRKLEVQGPSNSYFSMQANLHHNRPRVPEILRTFLVMYCMHLHKLEQA